MNNFSQKSLSSLAKEGNSVKVTDTPNFKGKGHKMEPVSNGFVKQGDCFVEANVFQKKDCPEKSMDKCVDPCEDPCAVVKTDKGCGNWLSYLFWFVIIAIIVWFLLFSLKPDFVQKKDEEGNTTGEVDQGRVLIT